MEGVARALDEKSKDAEIIANSALAAYQRAAKLDETLAEKEQATESPAH